MNLEYLRKFVHANAILIISAPVNYAVYEFLLQVVHLDFLLALLPVIGGDIAGVAVNWLLATKTGLIDVGSNWRRVRRLTHLE